MKFYGWFNEIMCLSLIIFNTATTAALFWIMKQNPRFMLKDYPEEIIAIVPPQTDLEKKGARLHGLPFLLLLLFYPLITGWFLKISAGLSFFQNWKQVFCFLFSFNLIDLLLIDWLIFCTITPKIFVIPGSEGHPAYKDYRFHLIAFVKGTGFSVLGSLVLSGLIEIIYGFIQ